MSGNYFDFGEDLYKMNKIINEQDDDYTEEKTLDISSCELEGIDTRDYPDFVDAYVIQALWDNGEELSEKELDQLNDSELLYDIIEHHVLRG